MVNAASRSVRLMVMEYFWTLGFTHIKTWKHRSLLLIDEETLSLRNLFNRHSLIKFMLLSESGLWTPLKSDESMAELRISWFPNWYEICIMNLKWWKVTDLVKKW